MLFLLVSQHLVVIKFLFAEGDPLYYTVVNWFRFFPKPLLDLTEGHKEREERDWVKPKPEDQIPGP